MAKFMTNYKSAPATIIAPDCKETYSALQSMPLAILCGRNNSGKSFLLRKLMREIGRTASYLGPARYQNFSLLTAISPDKSQKQQKWNDLLRHFQNSNRNVDNSPWNLAEAIAELSDSQRDLLLNLLDKLLSTTTRIQYTVPDNSMSHKYISVDGHNISFTSSGYRLVASLLTSLLDTDYESFLIDEPELGLSPEIQGFLSDLLLNQDVRAKYFPHIKSVILATHSPIFLDRRNIGNNFFVERSGAEISIRQLTTVQDINSLQFFLLGNRFETLFLPSAIVLVEGSCDYDYLNRLISLRYPTSLVSVIRCDGDGRIREVVNIARQMLTDLRRSPYAERMFVVLDSIHGKGITEQLIKMGVSQDNIIVWDANGIEYVYPRSLLERRFGKFEHLSISGDEVSANGIVVRKKELAEFVVQNLNRDSELPEELSNKLLKRLGAVLY